jgi:cleavage stimulation factor subunit 3
MDQLRKVYHKAVQIPLTNVERLWTELEAFENGLNRIVVRTLEHVLSWIPPNACEHRRRST